MTELVVELKNIFKTYRIRYDEKSTLFDTIASSLKKKSPISEFNALSNISLNVNKGEMVGIIGHNGSGKTTLLKIICGILNPSSGSIKSKGKIVPFLQLGSGFHPDLTAIENIKMYGMILGIGKKEIEKKVQDVLKYSELESFKDTKAKNFSSGMFARLAFATAVQADPDILVVDEVLSVGDLAFQNKSYNSFLEMKNRGKTIIYVTHNLDDVLKLCDRAVLMYKGFVVADDNPSVVVDKYRTVVEKSPNYPKENLTKEIEKLYYEFLERPPDPIGVLEYVYKIKKGELKLNDLPQIFKNSSEYLEKNHKLK